MEMSRNPVKIKFGITAIKKVECLFSWEVNVTCRA